MAEEKKDTYNLHDAAEKFKKTEAKRKQQFFEEIENRSSYNEKKLSRDLEEIRTNTEGWYAWRKAHVGKGIYASWKDDSFFKWLTKEWRRNRTWPFLLAGITGMGLFYAFSPKDGELIYESINYFPYGNPPGQKLDHQMQDLVERDYGTSPLHIAPRYQVEKPAYKHDKT